MNNQRADFNTRALIIIGRQAYTPAFYITIMINSDRFVIDNMKHRHITSYRK